MYQAETVSDDGMSLVSHSPDAGLREIIRSEFYFGWVDFSPDGKWIVYGSNEAGSEFHVFVRPFPGPGASIQISGEDQAARSCWSRDGDEIFYQTSTDSSVVMNAVPVTVEEGQLVPGRPGRLFEGLYMGMAPNRSWDVGQDGRFLMIQRIPDHPDLDDWTHGATRIRVVQNWFEELKAVASTEE
jgi:hypothetical protein